MKIIIASNNTGKIKEYKQLLKENGFDEVLSLNEARIKCEPEETGDTFEENAAIKARALHKLSGCACIADDSGLVVDALDGEPGVYSARWLDIENDDEKNAEIIRRLEGVPGVRRTARFVCAISFIYENGEEITASGVCEGKIGCEPYGDNGFGYDPIFCVDGRTIAQMHDEEKNAISHRGRALRELADKLKQRSSIC